jgi:hypothetical protein
MISSTAKFLLNRFSGKGQSVQLGKLLDKTMGVIVDTYDFSVSGGAVGDITLASSAIPAGAVITRVFHEELTNVTSGGSATVTLKAGATALTDAVAIATFSGVKSEALASSATAIKVSAASDLKITIATAALTAGKVRFYVEYMISQDTE